MKSTYQFILLLLLQALTLQVKAESDEGRVFRTITASDGLADNSAQTIKCTFTGRMTITTIGNINFYDGANFSHIDSEQEVKYKLEDYNVSLVEFENAAKEKALASGILTRSDEQARSLVRQFISSLPGTAAYTVEFK